MVVSEIGTHKLGHNMDVDYSFLICYSYERRIKISVVYSWLSEPIWGYLKSQSDINKNFRKLVGHIKSSRRNGSDYPVEIDLGWIIFKIGFDR